MNSEYKRIHCYTLVLIWRTIIYAVACLIHGDSVIYFLSEVSVLPRSHFPSLGVTKCNIFYLVAVSLHPYEAFCIIINWVPNR